MGSKTQKRSHERAIQINQARKKTYKQVLKKEGWITRLMAWGYHYLFAGVELTDFDKNSSRLCFLKAAFLWPFKLDSARLLVASLRGRY
jgi:hypothetical protein